MCIDGCVARGASEIFVLAIGDVCTRARVAVFFREAKIDEK